MARCLACGKEFDLRDSHDCPHEPTDSSRRQRARIIELLERIVNTITFTPLQIELGTINPDASIHYPLPGDPEPIIPSSFEPLTPDDQAAVERWKSAEGLHPFKRWEFYETEQLEHERASIQAEIDRRKSNG